MTEILRRLDAAWLREARLSHLLAVLDGAGEESRVVGGAVRNALLAEPIGEIDVATTALPAEVIRRAQAAGFKAVPTGIEHGTITVVVHGQPFEVTTLREDVETFGRHAKVAFGRDWKQDAERRDFTMNALSAARDGAVYDYVGGLADVAARRVRFIGDAAARIAEDYLRILRFFRFHAAYGEGALDPAGLAACIAGRAGLDQLSRERVRAELLKLLLAKRAVPAIAAMTEAGLLDRILGGVPLLASHAKMGTLEATLGLAPDAMRRLAALAVSVVEDAERLRERLRLTNAEFCALRLDGRRLVAYFEPFGRAGRAGLALSPRTWTLHRSRAAGLGALVRGRGGSAMAFARNLAFALERSGFPAQVRGLHRPWHCAGAWPGRGSRRRRGGLDRSGISG